MTEALMINDAVYAAIFSTDPATIRPVWPLGLADHADKLARVSVRRYPHCGETLRDATVKLAEWAGLTVPDAWSWRDDFWADLFDGEPVQLTDGRWLIVGRKVAPTSRGPEHPASPAAEVIASLADTVLTEDEYSATIDDGR